MGYFDELKAPAERVLDAELDDHLESEASEGRANRRNGYSKKTVRTETAKVGVRIPRDREGTFDPKLIQRYQRRFPGFDQDCFDVRARHERAGDPELYGIDVSPDLISTVPTQFL
jgi:putative transposase